jgi:hypothetical protein
VDESPFYTDPHESQFLYGNYIEEEETRPTLPTIKTTIPTVQTIETHHTRTRSLHTDEPTTPRLLTDDTTRPTLGIEIVDDDDDLVIS